jgi:hypothetical protein
VCKCGCKEEKEKRKKYSESECVIVLLFDECFFYDKIARIKKNLIF